MSEKIRTMGDAVDAWIQERILSDPVLARQYLDAVTTGYRRQIMAADALADVVKRIINDTYVFNDGMMPAETVKDIIERLSDAHDAYRANGTEADHDR